LDAWNIFVSKGSACEKARKTRMEVLARERNNVARKPADCNEKCCDKLSFLISLGDPCDPTDGHSGIAFGDVDYFDFGPQRELQWPWSVVPGGPWWDKEGDGDFNPEEIIRFLRDKFAGVDDVVMVSVCVEGTHVARAFAYWQQVYSSFPSFCVLSNQCTSKVCQSLDVKCRDWRLISPQRWFEMLRLAHHRCGPSKGSLAHIDILTEVDWTKVPLPSSQGSTR
jgi:hypothetical protein